MTEYAAIEVELTTSGAPPGLLLSRKATIRAKDGWRLVAVVVDPIRSRMIGFLERDAQVTGAEEPA